MGKKEIIKLLNEISIIYEMMDENFFKIRAYANLDSHISHNR